MIKNILAMSGRGLLVLAAVAGRRHRPGRRLRRGREPKKMAAVAGRRCYLFTGGFDRSLGGRRFGSRQ